MSARSWRTAGVVLCAAALSARAPAAVTWQDNFTSSANYVANGIRGTIWDGLYLSAGDLANGTSAGAAPGSVSVADANLSSSGALTIASLETDWENAADDGVFLYKVITGDFDMSVRIVPPIDTGAYNFPGLMVRAFGTGGAPAPNGEENSLVWGRFDEYNIANMSKNNVNGVKTDIGRGTYPNTNYWLRITRSNVVFRLFEKATQAGAWNLVGTVNRSDFTGLPLQVGIEHSDYAGGATRVGRYANFSLTSTNLGPFAATPASATGLTMTTNAGGNLAISWTPGSGSAGSVVVVWQGTNILKQAPANGFAYSGNPVYGSGSSLPGADQFVVYAGSGSSVTVSNVLPGNAYNVAVFAYAGTGSSLAYDRTPPAGSISIPLNRIDAQLVLQGADVVVRFSANPGEWYWLQYSDSLSTPHWQNVVPGPVLFTNLLMTLVHRGGAAGPQRFYRLMQVDPLFGLEFEPGGVTSLQRRGDAFPTEYLQGGGRLGDAIIQYRTAFDAVWHTFQSSSPAGVAAVSYSTSPDGTKQTARYQITNSLPGSLIFESVFTQQQDALYWSLNATNLTSQTIVLGDLALPLPMNMAFSSVTASAMKHSFISGYGSFLFWMRPNSVGPYLLLTPADNTKLEFWDDPNPPLGYRAYIHSYVSGTNAAAQFPAVNTQGSRWRQPNTSLTLMAGGSQSYGFQFQWANDYDAIRQALVDEGKIDVHIVPGMTVPLDLFAQFALRTTQAVSSVTAEFPAQTQIQFLGTTNAGSGNTYQLYRVQFSQLGENELTIQYGNGRSMYLEFFVTEPLETVIKKRAAFLVSKQVNDAGKWYNGLFCDWNMNDELLITPDNQDTLTNTFQAYEIASDDAGESRPAYMAEKEAAFPLQNEVTALDNYIRYFVWGGLQRATNETYSYAIYGVPDWHTLRTNNNLSIGRGYDYPHIFAMYYGMYRVAKYHPEVTTLLPAQVYLQRAWGTAMALWSYGGAQATHVGLMNELVIPDIIDALQAEGMISQAASLRANWEQKVNYYITGQADLFASEYAFDSTGFESQQAYARYALQHAGSSLLMGSTNVSLFLQQAQRYALTQITANVFDRGWLETAYYYYGSDYRGDMGDDYVVTYMAQEGGWGLLDYALYYATNVTDYLRLGYASYLNGWSTFNSGTLASNYGFWYPGAANDGGCGGGFEPSPYNYTWLGGQPMHRGAWYYSAEQNLGYCGAVRSAATILADDPIFGRFCYGGSWQQPGGTNQVVPLDGVRKRFHALLTSSTLHVVLNADRFAATQAIAVKDDLSLVSFQIESGNPNAHNETVRLNVSTPGLYTISNNHGVVGTINLIAGQDTILSLPVDADAAAQPFVIAR